MTNIVVLGNCQAQLMEGLFQASQTVFVKRLPPTFEMNDSHKTAVLSSIAEADCVFLQRVASDYPIDWLRSATIKQEFPEKTWIWPNIYFDGYFPETRYIYLNVWNKLLSPLEDYHLSPVLNAYQNGNPINEACESLTLAASSDPFFESLSKLREREIDCDLRISDFIEANASSDQMFYTPNHPKQMLLIEMNRRLAAAANIEFNSEKAAEFPYQLNKIHIPPFPWVRKQYNLTFDVPPYYKGLEIKELAFGSIKVGESMNYTTIQLIEAFYRIYDLALPARKDTSPGIT